MIGRPRPRRDGGPDLQRGREPCVDRRPAARGPARASTCWWSTTALPTAPAASPTSWRQPTRRSRSCTAPQKAGLGAAYRAGFRVALDAGYDVIGEMDADGSHQPEQLQRLLDAHPDCRPRHRLALGPRRLDRQLAEVARGALARRQPLRPAAARHPRARRHRRLPACSAAPHWRRSTSTRCRARATSSRPTWPTARSRPGLKVVEVPIEFIERERGDSKMSRDVATESLKSITTWGLRERARQVRRKFRRTRGEVPAMMGPGRRRGAAAGSAGCWCSPSWWCRWSRSTC